jgi:hypothetical protein
MGPPEELVLLLKRDLNVSTFVETGIFRVGQKRGLQTTSKESLPLRIQTGSGRDAMAQPGLNQSQVDAGFQKMRCP